MTDIAGRAIVKYRQYKSGFTLLELLCALAVVAIIAVVGIPGFGRLMVRNQLAVTTNELLSTMMAARTLAVTRNVSVTFCAGNPDDGCHRDWALGEWMTFIDGNRNGHFDPGDQLQIVGRLKSTADIALTANGPFKRAVVFRPGGLARTATGAFAAGRIRICATQPIVPNANDLVLIGSGRTVTEQRDFGGRCPLP